MKGLDRLRFWGVRGMLIGMVDVIFSDVAQPDQARIVTHNAGFFLKNSGWVMRRGL